MSKWAEVVIQTIKVFAVEVEDNESIEDAEKYALDECLDGEHKVKGSYFAKTEDEASCIRRHADEHLV